MKKKTKTQLFSLIIIINPIIDLIAGISKNVLAIDVSIAGLIRSVILALVTLNFFYEIIAHKLWYKRRYTLGYIGLSLIYTLIFLFIRYREFDHNFFFQQVMFFVRYISFPIYIICLQSFVTKDNLGEIKDVLIKTLFIYSLLIIIPFITHTGFDAYAMEGLEGTVGWFVGANEIGGIIGLLSSIYLLDVARRRFVISDIIQIPLPLGALLIVGTKAAFLYAVLYIAVLSIILYHKSRFRFKKTLFSILGLSSVAVLANSPAINNLAFIFSKMNPSKILAALLSGRLTFLNQTRIAYYGSTVTNKLFGIGFFSYHQDSILKVDKLIEMDFHDILFRTGIFGSILIFLPMLVICVIIVRSLIVNKKHRRSSFFVSFFVIVTFLSGLLIGHVFSAPSVSFFVALLLIVLYEVNREEERII